MKLQRVRHNWALSSILESVAFQIFSISAIVSKSLLYKKVEQLSDVLYERLSLWEFFLWMKLSWASCDPHSRRSPTRGCQLEQGVSSPRPVPAAPSSPENCACMSGFCGHSAVVLPPSLPDSLSPSWQSQHQMVAVFPFTCGKLRYVGSVLTGDPLLPHPFPTTWIHHSFPNSLYIIYISTHIFSGKGWRHEHKMPIYST